MLFRALMVFGRSWFQGDPHFSQKTRAMGHPRTYVDYEYSGTIARASSSVRRFLFLYDRFAMWTAMAER
jgi:hypothetical protein